MIVLQNVSRSYSIGETTVNALAGVNLEIGRGEFVAVMGQSGSGKTTMMNIIGLLDRPTGGRYVFADHDVSQFSENARARLRGRALGFVFQSYNLLPRLTALEQVELPLHIPGRSKPAEASRRGPGTRRPPGPHLSSPNRALRRGATAGHDRAVAGFQTLLCCSPTNPLVRWTRRQGTS